MLTLGPSERFGWGVMAVAQDGGWKPPLRSGGFQPPFYRAILSRLKANAKTLGFLNREHPPVRVVGVIVFPLISQELPLKPIESCENFRVGITWRTPTLTCDLSFPFH